jgi:hypothetical protein
MGPPRSRVRLFGYLAVLTVQFMGIFVGYITLWVKSHVLHNGDSICRIDLKR